MQTINIFSNSIVTLVRVIEKTPTFTCADWVESEFKKSCGEEKYVEVIKNQFSFIRILILQKKMRNCVSVQYISMTVILFRKSRYRNGYIAVVLGLEIVLRRIAAYLWC
jgi:hypothetical protein